MNETRDIKDIEQVYQTLLENEDNKVWKSGDCPEALGDSPMATDVKPEEPCSTPDSECVTGGKAVTPEGAGEENTLYMKKISERLKENQEKHGKSVRKEINTSRIMSDEPKNIFDKLYSTIMEGDDPFAELGGMEDDLGGDELGGDEELDLGGDEVTLNLPRDIAEQLCDALKAQLGEGGEEEPGGEEDMGEDAFDDEMLGDSVVSQPEPKPLGGHGDRQHKDAGNTSSGSNKVNNPKTKAPGE